MSSKRLKDIEKFREKFQEYYGDSGMSWREMFNISYEVKYRILSLFIALFFIIMFLLYQTKFSFVVKKEQTFQYLEKITPDKVYKSSIEIDKNISIPFLLFYSLLFSAILSLLIIYLSFKSSMLRRYFLKMI
jgi:flagellar biosynthesis protein FliR